MSNSRPYHHLHVSILRHRRQDDAGVWEEHEVPAAEGTSVLGLLQFVYDSSDTSLGFPQSCRVGKCMVCYVLVNGRVCLACTTLAEDGMRIAPHPKHRLCRDLLVDFNSP